MVAVRGRGNMVTGGKEVERAERLVVLVVTFWVGEGNQHIQGHCHRHRLYECPDLCELTHSVA